MNEDLIYDKPYQAFLGMQNLTDSPEARKLFLSEASDTIPSVNGKTPFTDSLFGFLSNPFNETFNIDKLSSGIDALSGYLNTGLNGANAFNYNSQLGNLDKYNTLIDTLSVPFYAGDYDALSMEAANRKSWQDVNSSDVRGTTAGQRTANTLSQMGSTFMTAPGGLISKAVQTGAVGLAGLLGNLKGNKKAFNTASSLNEEGQLAQLKQNYALKNQADLINANIINNQRLNFANGGMLEQPYTNGVNQINSGGSHEMNPLGGVPLGQDPQGTPNLVEEGEVIYNNYVYSARNTPNEELLQSVGLPSKYKDMTFADIATKLQKESEERQNDPISINGLNASMQKLAAAQDKYNQVKQQETIANQFGGGGNLSVNDTISTLEEVLDYSHKYDPMSVDEEYLWEGPEHLQFDDNKYVRREQFRNISEDKYSSLKRLSKEDASYIKDLINYGVPRSILSHNYGVFFNSLGEATGMLPNKTLNNIKHDWNAAYRKDTKANSMENAISVLQKLGYEEDSSEIQSLKAKQTKKETKADSYLENFGLEPSFNYTRPGDTSDISNIISSRLQGKSLRYDPTNLYGYNPSLISSRNLSNVNGNPNASEGYLEAPIADATRGGSSQNISNTPSRISSLNPDSYTVTPQDIAQRQLIKSVPSQLTGTTVDNVAQQAAQISKENYINSQKNSVNPTLLRYAPIVNSGMTVLSDALGFSNVPDYSVAEALNEAADNLHGVTYIPQGYYISRNPINQNYNTSSIINANLGANRAAQNSGNRYAAMAQALASQYGMADALSKTYLQNAEYNAKDALQASTFNRATDEQNASRSLQAQAYNSSINQQRQNLKVSAAQARAEEKARVAALKNQNRNNFIDNLSDYGKEQAVLQMLQNPAFYYGYRNNSFTPVKVRNGGKIKTQK